MPARLSVQRSEPAAAGGVAVASEVVDWVAWGDKTLHRAFAER